MLVKYIDAIKDVYHLNKNGFNRALASSVGIALTEVGAMYSIFIFLSIFFESNGSKLNGSIKNLIIIDPSEHKYLTALCFFSILILFLLIKLSCVKVLNSFIFNTESILSSKMVANFLMRDYIYLKNKSYSEINKLIFSEAGFIIKGILSPLVNMSVQLVIIFSIMAVLVYQSIILSISSLLMIVLIYLIIALFSKSSITKSSNERHLANNQRFKYLETIFSLRRQIKLKSREDHFIGLFTNATKKFAHSQIVLNNISAFPRMIGELAIGLLAIIFVAVTAIDGIDIKTVIPILGLFLIGAYKLIQPLQTLFSSFASIRHSWPAFLEFRREGYFLNNENNRLYRDYQQQHPMHLEWKKIHYKKLSYSITTTEEVFQLNDINFEMNVGEVIGIVGKSGVGKSTLIDIISGLIIPDEFIFSADDNNINYKDYTKYIYLNVGYVPHDFEILPTNIYENIALGSVLTANEIGKIKYYLTKMEMEFLVEDLTLESAKYPNLLNSLSEGQKQRIALIRSIFHDPAILILDEFTSAMDAHTEEIILNILNDLKSKKFILMVSHRTEPLKICDHIYKLEKSGMEKYNRNTQ